MIKPKKKKRPTIRATDRVREYKGIVEIEFRDRHGNILDTYVDPNLVKIFAKEIISHRLVNQVWDPTGGTSGTGAWVDSGTDPDDLYSLKYMLLGASFDDDGTPLDSDDSRFYTTDPVTGLATPVSLGVGADNLGDLINPIPIAEPDRPLIRIESQSFESTYQPAGTPLLQSDVRSIGNTLVLEATISIDEYNGFSGSEGDFFTLTEVGLAAGPQLTTVGACECTPRQLFLDGTTETDGAISPLPIIASGTDTVSLADSVTDLDLIQEGDQVMIVSSDSTNKSLDTLTQITPFYEVIAKSTTGRDIQLDRVPLDSGGVALSGTLGIYKDTLRLFSHLILSTPVRITSNIEVGLRWRIILS